LTAAAVATMPAAAKPRRAASQYEWWGRALVVPYLLVFAVFVLYPVCYGLWLARHPESYVKLFDDPVFFRTAINTVVFLVVAINIKMFIAMVLSGFFIQARWWIKALSLIFICRGRCLRSPRFFPCASCSTRSGASSIR
jgi:multiple sugar transport system permease protein